MIEYMTFPKSTGSPPDCLGKVFIFSSTQTCFGERLHLYSTPPDTQRGTALLKVPAGLPFQFQDASGIHRWCCVCPSSLAGHYLLPGHLLTPRSPSSQPTSVSTTPTAFSPSHPSPSSPPPPFTFLDRHPATVQGSNLDQAFICKALSSSGGAP